MFQVNIRGVVLQVGSLSFRYSPEFLVQNKNLIAPPKCKVKVSDRMLPQFGYQHTHGTCMYLTVSLVKKDVLPSVGNFKANMCRTRVTQGTVRLG